jgi:protein TonB
MPPPPPQPSVEVVFEKAPTAAPRGPPSPEKPTPPAAAPAAPTPDVPPNPEATEPAPEPTPPAPTPQPQPAPQVAPVPPVPAPVPAPPVPTPAAPAPTSPAPPRVEPLLIAPPPPEAEGEPFRMPQPPPPLPPLPQPPRVRPAPRPPAPAQPRSEFTPMFRQWSLGQPPGSQAERTSPGRGIDMRVSPVDPTRGRGGTDQNIRVVAGRANRDWLEDLHAWVEAHKYYPRQAAENGEDGTSIVRVHVTRDGRVQSVELVDRSGSVLLDLALQSMFRRALLPAFPPSMADPDLTFDFEMHYILIR